MDSGFVRAVLAAMLALSPYAVRAAAFESGPRPSGAVFDPDGILNAAERKEISASLEMIHKEDGVEVITVVLAELESFQPDETAGRLAAAWCDAPLHAVALHVPGREDSPWIATGGDLIRAIDPDEVRDELAAARRDASREPDDVSKVRTAVHATADMLRYWKGREVTRRAVIENERALIRLELETRSRRLQIIMLTVAAAAIPLIIGAVISARLLGKSRRVPASRS